MPEPERGRGYIRTHARTIAHTDGQPEKHICLPTRPSVRIAEAENSGKKLAHVI